jgi:hypothetical protein
VVKSQPIKKLKKLIFSQLLENPPPKILHLATPLGKTTSGIFPVRPDCTVCCPYQPYNYQ